MRYGQKQIGMSLSKQQSHFSSRHHLVVVILVSIAGVVIIARLNSGWHVAERPETAAASVALQLDPNIASVEELAAIPGVGPAMAGRIVAYRDRQVAAGRNPAFVELSDLDRVEGIGQATLEAIGPSLCFGNTGR